MFYRDGLFGVLDQEKGNKKEEEFVMKNESEAEDNPEGEGIEDSSFLSIITENMDTSLPEQSLEPPQTDEATDLDTSLSYQKNDLVVLESYAKDNPEGDETGDSSFFSIITENMTTSLPGQLTETPQEDEATDLDTTLSVQKNDSTVLESEAKDNPEGDETVDSSFLSIITVNMDTTLPEQPSETPQEDEATEVDGGTLSYQILETPTADPATEDHDVSNDSLDTSVSSNSDKEEDNQFLLIPRPLKPRSDVPHPDKGIASNIGGKESNGEEEAKTNAESQKIDGSSKDIRAVFDSDSDSD